MGKDVILDRYARLYEIPHQLARLGHDVRGYCLSYQKHADGAWQHELPDGALLWESRSLGGLKVAALASYPWHLLRRLRAFGPDVLIGASDIPHSILTQWLAGRLGVPYAIDLYDNFEGFGQARIPGFVPALRRAVRNAALVTTTSEPLRELVANEYRARGTVIAMPSTIDTLVFHPLDKAICRRALGLPEDVPLVGTAGGLLANRGVDVLYQGWKKVIAAEPRAHLVLAGPVDPHCPPPSDDRIHYLGLLPHARTAELFNALDVGVIYLRDTVFGRYCFPQKAYEMQACRLPLAAARIGVMPDFLATAQSGLYQADDPEDLARAVLSQLRAPKLADVPILDWEQAIGSIEHYLNAIVIARRSNRLRFNVDSTI